MENPYVLLTPGPLSTSKTVKEAMMRDWCTWDDDYNVGIVQEIRRKLVELATGSEGYTSVLMQGSGTFSVEATLGTVVPDDGRLLVLANGAYGKRLAQIAARLRIDHLVEESDETSPPHLAAVERALKKDPKISHVVMVHGETTTGMLNPVEAVGEVVKRHERIFIVDAMSTFGGVPMDMDTLGIDFIISSANKCIQGVPGFGFTICKRERLEACQGQARSLSLDLFDQWRTMEQSRGKWRYTSPTHTVRAFAQALVELEEEGGIPARHARYCENHRILVEGMEGLGIRCLLPRALQSPIITAFYNPDSPDYTFKEFYTRLKKSGFVIYPGKVTDVDTFRVGSIGHVFPDDFRALIESVRESMFW
ncbi:MAG: 2-aminoethylphosphonate--pyruvate transaminase [Planctomycetes bacterium]|nr:2-aminoethylphosphonate--pyruvate transaminase [Planctomycetota bacterium]